jgi:hypothetical protein
MYSAVTSEVDDVDLSCLMRHAYCLCLLLARPPVLITASVTCFTNAVEAVEAVKEAVEAVKEAVEAVKEAVEAVGRYATAEENLAEAKIAGGW